MGAVGDGLRQALRLTHYVAGLGHGFDRILCLVERGLGDGDGDGVVLAVAQLCLDACRAEDLLHLLGLGHISCDGDSNQLGHCGADDTASWSRRREAPPLTSSGVPRSAYGTSTTSKSRGTTVSAKIARASSAISGPKYRLERWVRASKPTFARWAT